MITLKPRRLRPFERHRSRPRPSGLREGIKNAVVGAALLVGLVGASVSHAGPDTPKLYSMSPTSGPPGTVVVFEGVNLDDLQWVEFAGTPAASFTSISSTRFEAVVPLGVTRGRVVFATDVRRVWGPVFKPTAGDAESPAPAPAPEEPAPDTSAPSAPANVRVTAATEFSLSVAWDASTDDVGVNAYGLFRDGSLTGTTAATGTTFNGLPCGRSFTFAVNASDAAGNRSQLSSITVATTSCSPPPADDGSAPTAPGNLRSTGATQSSVQIAWAASSDDVGVAGYTLFRNGVSAGTTAGTAATFSGLACGTAYTFAVEAYDAAGNRSPRTSAGASTSACAAPAPAPPPPSGSGTTLTLTDTFWRCTQPIRNYAVNGLPLRVVMLYTRVLVPPAGGGAVQIGDGCVGDGTPATDLVLDIRGDGRTYGPGDDAIRLMNGTSARDLEIEGRADCGPRQGAAHQDGVQVLGGTNITFRNFEIGNYDAGTTTCQGAGGAFFYSGSSTNVRVEGGKFIACNHALLAGWPSPSASVRNASFRTGGDPVCVQDESFAVSTPCDIRQEWRNAGGTTSGLTCQRWNGAGWVTSTS